MDLFGVLKLIGGLALFLFGMSVMGDSLVKLSGGKLERILEKLTGKPLYGLLLGTLVTAVIQSSSATTVMVVGLVNSGIMNLSQAVGVIMGANIGTTVTSWILSLAGIESSNLWIRLLKPSSFSPILAAVGMILYMSAKDGTGKKHTGTVLLGFAVLMFGMETMTGAVSPLKNNATFTGMLTAFENPVLGMMAGAILTAIIQSSSASVGILQALCISGAVSYGSALPIIMGQNIGTCVTAMISSVGAGKNARRAALIHLYFNVIGTTLFMTVFYLIHSLMPFAFMGEQAGAAGIAVIHSCFNIGCAIVLFPFSGLLVKLATISVKDRGEEPIEEEAVLAALDERFLDNPSFAMQLCRNAVNEMAEKSKQAITLAMNVVETHSEEKIQSVIALEQLVDHYEDVLGSYLVKLAGKDMSREDSQLFSVLLYSISDLERITDHAVNLTTAVRRMEEQQLTMTDQGKQELRSLGVAIRDIMTLTTYVFEIRDTETAKRVEPLEEVIDDLVKEMKQRHVCRLRNGLCSMEAGLILEDILTDYARVSDHCSNIAAALIETASDALDMHAYLRVKVKGGDPAFRAEYQRLKEIYILP